MYAHEPRSYGGRLYCLADGEPWPCPAEVDRRTHSRHRKGDCPACARARAELDANRAEADAALALVRLREIVGD